MSSLFCRHLAPAEMRKTLIAGVLVVASVYAGGCAGPVPGPDKAQFGAASGAMLGAGSGAVVGAQVTSMTGPGVFIGAGLGAVAGGIRGVIQDQLEDDLLALSAEARRERERAWVQELLTDHYARRMELHPTRDIYPADWFFRGDERVLRPIAQRLVEEIALMNKERLAWSRLAVHAYVRSSDAESSYAQQLAEGRAREIFDWLVKAGIEPRRIVARGILVPQAVLVDPADDPFRYAQAIELIPLDR